MIYFLAIDRGKSDERVKIGYTADEWGSRLSAHKNNDLGQSVTVDTLCVVRGVRSDEKALHRHFKECKWDIGTEIFHPSKELVDYIRWLRNQYFVWIPDCDLYTNVTDLPPVTFADWGPGPGRAIPPIEREPGVLPLFSEPSALVFNPREVTGDDFYTDESILDQAREVMGGIDLDPASHPVANMKVRAERFFTLHDDGLRQKWYGRVWCNPPFNQWQEWTPKIVGEWESGRVDEMCILLATRSLTNKCNAAMHQACSAICILHGRVPFWGPKAGSPDDGHAVFYFGDNVSGFRESFSRIGNVYLTSKPEACACAHENSAQP